MNWNPPDDRWLPFVKMAYGFFITALMVGLAVTVALGKVGKETSYGLEGIITGLGYLLAQFAGWAFADKKEKA